MCRCVHLCSTSTFKGFHLTRVCPLLSRTVNESRRTRPARVITSAPSMRLMLPGGDYSYTRPSWGASPDPPPRLDLSPRSPTRDLPGPFESRLMAATLEPGRA